MSASRTCIDCQKIIGPKSTRCRRCQNIRNNRLRARVPKNPNPMCETCKQPITRHGGGKDRKRFCSLACYRATHPPKAYPSSKVKFNQCLHCGTWHRTINNGGHCTAACRLQRSIDKAGARVKDLYKLATGLGYEPMRWRKQIIDALVERDGGLCCLCWHPIDFTLKSGPKGSDQGASIEHLTPRSKGGGDSLDNLALSHWGCNRQRKANPINVLWRAS